MRRSLLPWVIAATAMAGGACSAPASCGGVLPNQLASAVVNGSAELAERGDRESRHVRLSLRGGPVLTAQDTIGPMLSISLVLHYPEGPTGAVEMPRVRVAAGADTFETPRFPGTGNATYSLPMSSSCSVGSAACLGETTVVLERLDGGAFPRVAVDWRMAATLSVSDCPPDASAELELEVLQP